MAKRDLTEIGKILGLIGGIIAVIESVLYLLDRPVNTPVGSLVDTGEVILNTLVRVVLAALIIVICNDRVSITNRIVLGIILIVLGLLVNGIGGLLTIVGGILVIIDELS